MDRSFFSLGYGNGGNEKRFARHDTFICGGRATLSRRHLGLGDRCYPGQTPAPELAGVVVDWLVCIGGWNLISRLSLGRLRTHRSGFGFGPDRFSTLNRGASLLVAVSGENWHLGLDWTGFGIGGHQRHRFTRRMDSGTVRSTNIFF